jgi:hypothetical protein
LDKKDLRGDAHSDDDKEEMVNLHANIDLDW